MLLQTNSYIVPKDKRTEHARLVKQFKQAMARLGLPDFEVYEQAGPNWSTEVGGRFVQIMRFRDRDHQKAVREAEQADASAQNLIRDFCELVNFGYQQQQGLATTAYYLGSGATQQRTTDASQLPAPAALDEPPALDAEEIDAPADDRFHSGSKARAGANRDIDD